ncbi:MAG: hypothetical protein RLZ19_1479 [Actinomycetota bacterium]|jgi:hypothetical protein
MVRFLTTVVAVAVIAAACGGDSADIAGSTETVGAVVLPNSSSPESVGEDLLIDPTTDVESSGRPVVLWFWAPG